MSQVKPEETRAAESRIILALTLLEGLKGLEPRQHVMVVFHFHRSRRLDLLQHPRGDRRRTRCVVFALCCPRRPNPIGDTVADQIAKEKNGLRVVGLDAINGAPVLDLEPM